MRKREVAEETSQSFRLRGEVAARRHCYDCTPFRQGARWGSAKSRRGGKSPSLLLNSSSLAWLGETAPLDGLNVLSLPALGALHHVELHALAFLQ